MSNNVIIASAGSGKTTHLVRKAIDLPDEKILITTFTDENANEIKAKFHELNHCIPANITIMPWFTFLLQDGVRPFQGVIYKKRIAHVNLVSGTSTTYVAETDFRKYYLSDDETVYSDKLSKLVCKINELSKGATIARLEKVYSHIFIDEVQDLAGYDLEVLDLLFQSSINTLLVGDPRQATFVTNNSQKNKRFKYSNIDDFFSQKQKKNVIEYDKTTLNVNHRCIQSISDFANGLFPEYEATQSDYDAVDTHKGIWFVRPEDIHQYLQLFNPMILRHDKRTKTPQRYPVLNFGKSKGRTYKRVLIYPTEKIIGWIQKGIPMENTSRSKFYVALTRAQLSVAIVFDPKNKNTRLIPIFNPSNINNEVNSAY